jgi:hypothetical protein
MDSRLWRERLQAELRRQRLPGVYIDRLLDELADHLIDSQTENASMDAQYALDRLGTSEQLAAVARHEFTRRTFAGRHPLLTFVFGPLACVPVLLVVITVALCLILSAIAVVYEAFTGASQPAWSPEADASFEYWFAMCFNGFIRFLPFAVAAWIFCRLGRTSGMHRWSLVACCVVALIAGLFVSKTVAASPGEHGLWIIGLAVRPDLGQLIQILVPLAVAAWFFLRLRYAPWTELTAALKRV